MGNNGPDQGQTLAAADRWRTDGTERELAMLIEVRGGRSWRFLAPQSPIGCSLSSPPLLCSSAPAPPPPPGRTQQAVRLGLLCESTDCSCPCTSARCVCGWRAGKGEDGESKWGLAGRLLEATDIATKDNKYTEGGGAEQHRLELYQDPADGFFGDVSGDVCFD